ncbi:GNAT family N-acetyltransferase [Chitinophaga rhizophila]|uniref:GNAT family N-acetyltransferase n=1 Tax=Chitinophaga rhizophila TaxID=2866212 RepID=A0ABS7GE29_9BACT|nr:GNAT family N-acetyltransferase [Chitinophaga rhizophila]MBW8685591.1 GNAT family N-acetyltransferase [Chitinophaga rhizophila]
MIKWVTKTFEELTTQELYALLRLRSEIFVVEQKCAFQDMDNADQLAVHIMGYDDELDNELVAYTRIFGPGIKFDMCSIGRVVTAASVRGNGSGRKLMEYSIAVVEDRFGKVPIKIGAQLYLQKFYSSLGFEQSSEMYLEDDIPHIEMIREVAK